MAYGGALSNLTLFPRSTFVIIKLSGLSSSRTWPCRPLPPPPRDGWCFSQPPPPQARVDSNCWVVGQDIALWMRYPGSSSTTSAIPRAADVFVSPSTRISAFLLQGCSVPRCPFGNVSATLLQLRCISLDVLPGGAAPNQKKGTFPAFWH